MDVSAAWLIEGTLLAPVLFGVALATASLLVRLIPAVGGVITAVESTRHRPIDGLRGCLGIGVFIHHVAITWFYLHGKGWQTATLALPVTHLGESSVALFFMITAFLFWGRVLDRRDRFAWGSFLLSRVYRLYPVYLLMLASMLGAVAALTGPAAAHAATTAWPLLGWLLMQGTPSLNGLPHIELLTAGVTWSLRYEWLFYLALPMLAYAARQSRHWTAALLSLAVVGTLYAWPVWADRYKLPLLAPFLGGMFAAHWVRRPALCAAGRTIGGGLLAILALILIVTLAPRATLWEVTLGLTVIFTVIASGHSFGGVLENRALLWLGDVTYPIYLLHGLLLWLVFQTALPGPATRHPALYLLLAVGVTIVLVALSSVVFLRLERPAILLGRRHARWLAAHAAGPGPAQGVSAPGRD